ncbi:MAG TPA: rhodanese-like domain-containing protein [Candidatus Nanoarchaeia archaeon]|nr:rhodanese-like domain-containing protein [Candidatus Nanoarchaeia archaeon]
MVQKISAEQLKKKLDNKEPVIIIDVRTNEELQFGKIKSSIHIPMHLLPQQLSQLDKNKLIILYCHSGQRSSVCAEYLEKQGFKKVANLLPGILAWKKYDSSIKDY